MDKDLALYRQLGQVYRALTDVTQPDGVGSARMDNATRFPMYGITLEISLAHTMHKMTPKLDRICTRMFAGIHDDELMTPKRAASLPQQGEFQRGFLQGAESLDVLPDNVRNARQAADMSIRHLAELAEVSPSTITRIEAGDISPKADTLSKIADALGVKMSDLWPD